MTGGRQHTAARARWWQASTAATMLQLAVLAGLLVFVIDSLSMSSVSSRIVGRDLHLAHTDTDTSDPETFDVAQALLDLKEITRTPHSLNDKRSIGVRDFLRKTIGDITAGSEASFDDPVRNGTIAEFVAKGWSVYWEDSSLLVRVAGTSNHREALLVQAHYDAVPMSHGAFDDGVGVVTCLGLLRSLSKQPARHPVIVNIDWGEENGLFGAIMFSRFHPWADDVRAYINLEAGGVGGRAMVFRASHPMLLSAYKKSVKRPCASLIGNNAFRLGVVKSDTDYSVYTTRYGVPGLDIAFTDRRSLYHTARDSNNAATSDSIRSMGSAALATARLVADDANTLKSIPRSSRLPTRPQAAQPISARPSAQRLQAAPEEFGARRKIARIEALQHIVVQEPPAIQDNAVQDSVFYDILQRVMVVRSYSAETAINVITAIAGIAALVALQFPFTRPLPAPADPVNWSNASLVERLVLQLGRGAFFGSIADGLFALAAAYFAAILASLGLTGLLISLIAPRMAYTHVLLHTLLLLTSAAAASTYVLAVWTCRSRYTDISTVTWYSWCLLRCLVLLVVVAPLNTVGIGLFYREQLYAWAAIASAMLTAFIDPYTGLGQRWRHAMLLRSRPALSEEHREPLLDNDEQTDPIIGDSVDDHFVATSGSYAISRIVGAASVLRMVLGVLVPLVIGMDIMVRQLVIFKDHLVDGSPPIACTAIAALDLATFVLFLAPYVVGIISDADSYWLVSIASRKLASYIERLITLHQSQGRLSTNPASASASATATSGSVSPHARSQISLHTNHAAESQDYEAYQSPTDQYIESNDNNNGYDAYDNERIIELGGSHAQSDEAQDGVEQGVASRDSIDSEDDELGSRPRTADVTARKGEPPETVGLRMVYGWLAIYIVLWVAAQLFALGGESYSESANPMKVRAFQTTRVSRTCLQNAKDADSARCVHTRLALSSPDSHGLAGLVRSTAPSNAAYACYTQSTRDFYACNLVEKSVEDHAGSTVTIDDIDIDSAIVRSSWAAHSAINITSISHMISPAEHGTLFTVTLNFTALETRTCFIDFGSQKGFSMQAYPNPHPIVPPRSSAHPASLQPTIGRSVLPVIERATFVDGATGTTAAIVEPIRSRHPIYSNRIFAHKRDFDTDGQFSAVIQYSVSEAGVTRPAGAKIELSCYFDVLDRHMPLLASVINASPKWSVFTPARNTLSTVTLTDIEI
ncbi:hypothetical protein J3B02_003120 [Coemansia erecta]|nr:hypothetical protein J3B02_003120 [Coemansia erecta]KAJ2887648.1 hypothetical protein FB639_001161 [Coemansia asiatica]